MYGVFHHICVLALSLSLSLSHSFIDLRKEERNIGRREEKRRERERETSKSTEAIIYGPERNTKVALHKCKRSCPTSTLNPQKA